jgi:hypothetical protein
MPLGALGRLAQALHRDRILREIDRLFAPELGHQPLNDAMVKVVAAEVGVAVGGLHLKDALADVEHRHVEGAAAEVVHRDGLVLPLVEAVGQRGRGRFVDDALDVEAGNLARVLGRLALAVVEVSRNGDDRVGNGFAQIGFRRRFQVLQHHGRELGRRVGLAGDLHRDLAIVRFRHFIGNDTGLARHLAELAADEALDGVNRVFRVGHRLTLGQLSDQALAVLGDGDHRRGGTRTVGIGDDLRLPAFNDGDARVGGAEINSNRFAHASINPFGSFRRDHDPRWAGSGMFPMTTSLYKPRATVRHAT